MSSFSWGPLLHLRGCACRGILGGRSSCGLIAVVVSLVLLSAAAAAEPQYIQKPASPDGIGKLYMGREIARVMPYHGARWLERSEREQEERPDLLIRELELKPGMLVADVGAGTGYLSWRMANEIGDRGKVLALDIQPEMLQILARKMKSRGVTNAVGVLGEVDDPKLPVAQVDLVLLADVYHELQFPYEMLARIAQSLKPGGRLVIVEYKGDDPSVTIKPLHKMTEAQVRLEVAPHSLEWVRTVRSLPRQIAVIFRKQQ